MSSEPTLQALVVRQPIMDKDGNVLAHEIICQDGPRMPGPWGQGSQQAATTLTTALLDFGLSRVSDGLPAWLRVPDSFVLSSQGLPIEGEEVVLTLPLGTMLTPGLQEAMGRHRHGSLQFAFDDPSLLEEPAEALRHFRWARLPIEGTTEKLRAAVERARRCSIEPVALAVDQPRQYEQAREAGFTRFQGEFLFRPQMLRTTRLPTNRMGLLKLLSTLNDPEVSLSAVEKLVSQDVGLSVRLLKLLSSSIYALPRKVESIQHAVVMVGLSRLKNLVTLMAVSAVNDRPRQIIDTGLIRGHTAEQLARRYPGASPDACFTAGVFSVLDSLLQVPMERLLAEVAVSDELRMALLDRSGAVGRVLSGVLMHERADWDGIVRVHLNPVEVTQAYLDSVRWLSELRKAMSDSPQSSARTRTITVR